MPSSKRYEPTRVTDARHESRFRYVAEKVLMEGNSHDGGIGTLAEKKGHSILKTYLCESKDFHEVPVKNTRFVADVWLGDEIYEVQTGSFKPMVKKIAHYMEKERANVTVVHPLYTEKKVSWIAKNGVIDPDVSVSPRHASAFELLPELYFVRDFIGNPRFCIHLLFLKGHEYRRYRRAKNGRRIKTQREECVPTELTGELLFKCPEDYRVFLPPALPNPFCAKEYQSATPLRGMDVYSAIHALEYIGILREVKLEGKRASYWEIV